MTDDEIALAFETGASLGAAVVFATVAITAVLDGPILAVALAFTLGFITPTLRECYHGLREYSRPIRGHRPVPDEPADHTDLTPVRVPNQVRSEDGE